MAARGHGSDFLILASPVGTLLAEYTPDGVRTLRFWTEGAHPPARARDDAPRGDSLGRAILSQLREYFAAERRDFELPLAAAGTPFQQRVWTALREIPFGETRSYAEVAARTGTPGAPRAVGQANARNPLPIVVPCHRVVTRGGRIGGYMGSAEEGSGVARKRWLLRHEGAAGW
jgi:methylated-DNA-[protein]-cysteine S-methyltransferase